MSDGSTTDEFVAMVAISLSRRSKFDLKPAFAVNA